MFGTISFTKKGKYKTSKDHTFAKDENGRPARRFACRVCRLQKVKCSGDSPACARCSSLNLKCVYDKRNETNRRRASLDRLQHSNATPLESIWSLSSLPHVPSNAQGSKHRSNKESTLSHARTIELQGKEVTSDPLAEFTLDSPMFEAVNQTPPSEERTVATTSMPGLSPSNNDITSLDFFDESSLLELESSSFSLVSDGHRFISMSPHTPIDSQGSSWQLPTLADNSTPTLGTFPPNTSQDVANHQSEISSLFSPPSAGDCTCSNRFSTTLFILNGKVRRFRHDGASVSLPVEEIMQIILKAHTQSKQLVEEIGWCLFGCFEKNANRVLLVMIIEQLGDLYSTLVDHMVIQPHVPDEGTAIAVQVGGYMVESQAERQMILSLLVSERLKALIDFAATCRDKLATVAMTADNSRARLQSAIHDIELLRKRQERR